MTQPPDSPLGGGDEVLIPEVLAAFEQSAGRAGSPRRRRRRVLRGAGLGLAFALVGGTALAATGTWTPFGTSHPDRYSLSAPTADQQDRLAVLRRTQDDRDRGPLMSAFLQRYGNEQGRVLLRSVRFLRPVEVISTRFEDGGVQRRVREGVLVLIPNEQSGVHPAAAARPAIPGSLCIMIISDAWAGGAPEGWDPSPRKAGTTPPPRPDRLADRITGGGTCASPHQMRTKGLSMGAFNDGAITGIVPDGVASVRATTRDGQTVTDRVVNNAFQLLAPGRGDGPDPAANGPDRPDLPPLSGQFKHQTVQWLDGAGRVLRTMPQ